MSKSQLEMTREACSRFLLEFERHSTATRLENNGVESYEIDDKVVDLAEQSVNDILKMADDELQTAMDAEMVETVSEQCLYYICSIQRHISHLLSIKFFLSTKQGPV